MLNGGHHCQLPVLPAGASLAPLSPHPTPFFYRVRLPVLVGKDSKMFVNCSITSNSAKIAKHIEHEF